MQNYAHQKLPCLAVLPLSLRWGARSSRLPLKHKSLMTLEFRSRKKPQVTAPPCKSRVFNILCGIEGPCSVIITSNKVYSQKWPRWATWLPYMEWMCRLGPSSLPEMTWSCVKDLQPGRGDYKLTVLTPSSEIQENLSSMLMPETCMLSFECTMIFCTGSRGPKIIQNKQTKLSILKRIARWDNTKGK